MGKLHRGAIKHILVTGSRGRTRKGFIGSHMVKYLRKLGEYEVFESKGDLRDPKVAYNNLGGMDCVFHFAANMGGVGFFSKENYEPIMDNYLMDINIIQACHAHKIKRLFYPSSACAYNITFMEAGEKLRESMIDAEAKPDQMYGWEKLSILKLLRHSPLDARVGILHTIYGEGQEFTGNRAKFPPQIAYKAYKASKTKTKRIEVWGDGTQTRTFLHVSDAVKKIYEVTMSGFYKGEVNIGSDNEVAVDDVVNICAHILKFKPLIDHNLMKPTGPKRRGCSNVKFDGLYRTRETVDLWDGFTKLITFIKSHDER